MKMKKELFIRLLSERRFKELKEDLMTMESSRHCLTAFTVR